MKNKIFAFLVSGFWIGFSEFVRNELLFKSYWIEKYAALGLDFPSKMANNMVWGIWSFAMAGLILFLSNRLTLKGTIFASWWSSFLMMWLVVGNLNVLPTKLLLFAIPLSIIEVSVAAWISKKILV